MDEMADGTAEAAQAEELTIPVSGGDTLRGFLSQPAALAPAQGLVVFAQDLVRHEPQLRPLAAHMTRSGFAAVLIDLLTADESAAWGDEPPWELETGLLASRLVSATEWLLEHAALRGLPLGYFGSESGAAAVLVGACALGDKVRAVVAKDGRPDLAGPYLERVAAPALFIVGEEHRQLLSQTEAAIVKMPRAVAKLAMIQDDPAHAVRALMQVEALAAAWFGRYLQGPVEAAPWLGASGEAGEPEAPGKTWV